MQTLIRYRKAIILTILCLCAVLLASCASRKAGRDEEAFQALVPDTGSVIDTPIEDNEYSDDIIIGIERPDLKGDDDDEEETEGDKSEQTDGEPDRNDTEELPDEDDDELMGGYEGSNTEFEEEEETGETEENWDTERPAFDPDSAEVGANSGRLELYDVPLSAEKQSYVFAMAKEFGIPPELIFGVMYVESRYTETAVSANGKYIGIMQIAKSNLNRLNKKFGITDLTDYLQNVKAGAYFLSYFYKKYDGDIDKVLMCYHCGEGGAMVRWKNGITQDSYCRKVIKEVNRILAAM